MKLTYASALFFVTHPSFLIFLGYDVKVEHGGKIASQCCDLVCFLHSIAAFPFFSLTPFGIFQTIEKILSFIPNRILFYLAILELQNIDDKMKD